MSVDLRIALLLMTLVGVAAWSQTSADIGAKYTVVNAYEVRPGILMTVKYAEDGQACEITLEKRHYHSPEKIDLDSTIPSKLVDQLIDELVPPSERGQQTSRWLHPDSHIAGGVSYVKRDFENVSMEIHGSTSESCNGGDQVVIVRWKKRTCAAPQRAAVSSTRTHGRVAHVRARAFRR